MKYWWQPLKFLQKQFWNEICSISVLEVETHVKIYDIFFFRNGQKTFSRIFPPLFPSLFLPPLPTYVSLFAGHEVICHMHGQNVGQQLPVVRLQVFHLLLLLCRRRVRWQSMIGDSRQELTVARRQSYQMTVIRWHILGDCHQVTDIRWQQSSSLRSVGRSTWADMPLTDKITASVRDPHHDDRWKNQNGTIPRICFSSKVSFAKIRVSDTDMCFGK